MALIVRFPRISTIVISGIAGTKEKTYTIENVRDRKWVNNSYY